MYHFDDFIPQIASTAQLVAKGRTFLEISDLTELAAFVRTEKHAIKLMANYPKYDSFYVRKLSGGQRLIEEPVKKLKHLQRQLAGYLQGVYYGIKTDAAYGFIPVPGDEEAPRNIYTNACKHLGQQWVLNIDIRSFFHAIKTENVEKLFLATPFQLTQKAAETLAHLCTLHGRLPMGSPTSPVLSNLAFIATDHQLQALADQNGWKYTRYADDLTFSGPRKFGPPEIAAVVKILNRYGYAPNEQKTRLADIKTPPEVTGLVLKKDRPDVSAGFLQGIRDDIRLYNLITTDRTSQRGIFHAKTIKKLQQSIAGQLAFMEFVRGEYDESCIKLNLEFDPDKKRRGQGTWVF